MQRLRATGGGRETPNPALDARDLRVGALRKFVVEHVEHVSPNRCNVSTVQHPVRAFSALSAALALGCGLSLGGIASTADEDFDASVLPDAQPDAIDSAVDSGEPDSAAIADAVALDATADGSVPDATADVSQASIDAAIVDAAPPVLGFVHSAQGNNKNAASYALQIPPTAAGNFLAVMVTYSGNLAASVASITDNAQGGTNTYVTANARSLVGSCQASEIWFARDLRSGASTVTVAISAGQSSISVWATELSGLRSAGGADMVAAAQNAAKTNPIIAPTLTPSGAPALLIAAVGSCGTIGKIRPGNPFTGLPAQIGNGAAFYVDVDGGTFGAAYDNSMDGYNASAAAFR